MGIIPRYTQTILPQGGDASAISAAGQPFEIVQHGIDVAQKFKQVKDEMFVTQRSSQYEREIDSYFEQAKVDFQGDPDSGKLQFEKFMVDKYKEASKGASPEALMGLNRVKENLIGAYNQRWQGYAREQNVQNFAVSFDDTANNIAITAYNAGKRGEVLDDHLASLDASLLAGSGFLGETDLYKLDKEARQKVTTEYLTGMGKNNPQRLRSELSSGKYNLDVDQLQALDSYAEQKIKSQEAERRGALQAEIAPMIDDAIAEVQTTGVTTQMPDYGTIRAAYTPKQAEKIITQFEQAKSFGESYRQISTASPDEIMGILSQNAPQGEGFSQEEKQFNALQSAVEARQKAIKDDAGSYVIANFPDVRAAYQAYEESSDPRALQAAVELNLSAQEKIGVPYREQRVLGEAQASSLVVDLQNMKAGERLDHIKGLQQMYGDYYGDVYAEMVSAGLSDNLSVMMRMTSPKQEPAAKLLAEADANADTLKSLISTEANNEIDTSVTGLMSDFVSSVSMQPNNQQEALRTTSAVTTLARQYVFQGDSSSSAAQKAYDQIIGDTYGFSGNVRIPKKYDTDLVDQGFVEFLTSRLNKFHTVVLPDNTVSLSGVPDDLMLEMYKTEVADGAYFITNPAEDGVILHHRNGRPVLEEKNGKKVPLTIKFKDLEVYGRYSEQKDEYSPIKTTTGRW